MDPNLFHLDWGRTLEAVAGIVVLSFIVERVAALLFENRGFLRNTKVPEAESAQAAREAAAVAIARDIIGAADDAGVAVAIKDMKPDSPLWPPVTQEKKTLKDRAKDYLKDLEIRSARRQRLSTWPIKEFGAFLLAALVTVGFKFDVVAIILLSPRDTFWGELLTAAVIAGGSKASIKLFRDLLDFKSSSYRDLKNPPPPKEGKP